MKQQKQSKIRKFFIEWSRRAGRLNKKLGFLGSSALIVITMTLSSLIVKTWFMVLLPEGWAFGWKGIIVCFPFAISLGWILYYKYLYEILIGNEKGNSKMITKCKNEKLKGGLK